MLAQRLTNSFCCGPLYSSLRRPELVQGWQNIIVQQFCSGHSIDVLHIVPSHIIAGVCIKNGQTVIHIAGPTGDGDAEWQSGGGGFRKLSGDGESGDGGGVEAVGVALVPLRTTIELMMSGWR